MYLNMVSHMLTCYTVAYIAKWRNKNSKDRRKKTTYCVKSLESGQKLYKVHLVWNQTSGSHLVNGARAHTHS